MEIKWLKGTEDLSEAFHVRREVFIIEQRVDEALEWDEMDIQADHVVIYQDHQPVATGRLIVMDGQYMLGRIAVLKEYRGRDLGRVLVENLMDRAFEKGAKEIHIHAQTQARRFYEKLGFEAYGETYPEAGIEHISMRALAD